MEGQPGCSGLAFIPAQPEGAAALVQGFFHCGFGPCAFVVSSVIENLLTMAKKDRQKQKNRKLKKLEELANITPPFLPADIFPFIARVAYPSTAHLLRTINREISKTITNADLEESELTWQLNNLDEDHPPGAALVWAAGKGLARNVSNFGILEV